MDRVTDMQLFEQVVRDKTFTAVAKKLNTTHSMISKRMKRLEDRLGARLLNRTTRKLSLTEAGSVYLKHCKNINYAIESAEHSIFKLSNTANGTLKINAPAPFANKHVLPILNELNLLYPKLRVELELSEYYSNLIEEGFDLAIRIGILKDSTLISRKILNSQTIICASQKYINQYGSPQKPSDLKKHNCLTYRYSDSGSRKWHFGREPHQEIVPVKGTFQADNCGVLHTAALQGTGIAYLPDYLVMDDIKNSKLIPLLTDYPQECFGVYIVYPNRKNVPYKVKIFIDLAIEELSKYNS